MKLRSSYFHRLVTNENEINTEDVEMATGVMKKKVKSG